MQSAYAFANSALRPGLCVPFKVWHSVVCASTATVVLQCRKVNAKVTFNSLILWGPLFLHPIPTIPSNFTGWSLSSTSRLLWRQSRPSGRYARTHPLSYVGTSTDRPGADGPLAGWIHIADAYASLHRKVFEAFHKVS